MKIISTNIGEVKTVEWNGQKIQTGIFKKPVDYSIFLSKNGVKKDHVIDLRYHGGSDKACYLYSADHYSFWKERYPKTDFSWGLFGENLTVENMNESQLFIGDEFKVGEAIIQISQPRIPCYKLAIRFNHKKVVKEFIDFNLPGAYVRIIQEGIVTKNDSFELIDRKQNELSLQETNQLFYQKEEALYNNYLKAINSQYLAKSSIKEINKLWSK